MEGLVLLQNLWAATLESLYMVGVSTLFTILLGLPLGLVLVATRRGNILAAPGFNQLLGSVVNVGRSLPFIILLVALIPLTRLVVGTSIGSTAALVPLTIAAIPFFARIAETALLEVDRGLVEAAQAMGCDYWQIILKVLIPEALPSLVLGITITVISLLNYSAMAGAVGGGGLGDLAIRYGYQRFQTEVMLATVLVLIVLVQLVQVLGEFIAKQLRRR
ncbi:methionine ABC transporter permease [Leptolyngbya sp. FACHB-261]|uniref:methionine ABC transporter permease n=1 Tax=Leptolyngbya sp. FACHB-261 TaxID=2692806 RepID=UPI0016860AC5|nr:methionine ABC transporter permease [Leptolyngbya sp. FACHB-261]MBD2100049.1 ABC transporter permease [Leptolyngbya sp. FACHB-261]